MPRVEVGPDVWDWPVHRWSIQEGKQDILCHVNPQAVIHMENVAVVPIHDQPNLDARKALIGKLNEIIAQGAISPIA